MRIKNLEIGPEYPTRIIAELGTLHLHQTKDEILEVIGQCITAGADLVKLQFINPDTAWWASWAQLLRYKSLFNSWSIQALNDLMTEANKTYDTPVFASIFDPIFFDVEMPAIKLGYKVRYTPWMAIDAFNRNVPVIISCDNFSRLLYPNHPITKYLWVDPTYPMPPDSPIPPVDHNIWHGYSLHTNNQTLITRALAQAPELLELHVQGEGANGPDTSFALTINQLRKVRK